MSAYRGGDSANYPALARDVMCITAGTPAQIKPAEPLSRICRPLACALLLIARIVILYGADRY
jgi:hypothetical protein